MTTPAPALTDTTPLPAPTLIEGTVALSTGPVSMIVESTCTPGLVIAPTVAGEPARYTGDWSLTHHTSGWGLFPDTSRGPLIYAREAALALGASGIDWTATRDEIRQNTRARTATTRVKLALTDALRDNRPVLWGRDSHVPHPDPADPPQWRLRCAAPLCTLTNGADQPAIVRHHDDYFGCEFVHPDPTEVTECAVSQGWHNFGDHWLCPACITAHRHATEKDHFTTTLCGSTRFMADMTRAAQIETVRGNLVLRPECDLKNPDPLWPAGRLSDIKTALDMLHRAKIDAADTVLVVAPGGYIGQSTRDEIEYARQLGRPIRFYDPQVSTTRTDLTARELTVTPDWLTRHPDR